MLQKCQQFGQTPTLLEEYQLVPTLRKIFWLYLKTIIFNDPVIFLLGIHYKEIIRNLKEDLYKQCEI